MVCEGGESIGCSSPRHCMRRGLLGRQFRLRRARARSAASLPEHLPPVERVIEPEDTLLR